MPEYTTSAVLHWNAAILRLYEPDHTLLTYYDAACSTLPTSNSVTQAFIQQFNPTRTLSTKAVGRAYARALEEAINLANQTNHAEVERAVRDLFSRVVQTK